MNDLDAPVWAEIDTEISRALGRRFTTRQKSPVSGGCINSAVVVESGESRFFAKINAASRREMFEAEAAGLEEIANSRTVRVPSVVCTGTTGSHAFLVLEYLDMAPATATASGLLGAGLAAMHSAKQAGFGWNRDNTIGATPQPNNMCQSWPAFFRQHRIQHQLAFAKRSHAGTRALQSKGARLGEGIDSLFSGYAVYPSLLHGDLWGGNFSAMPNDEPVIFDPAVYYGDRETDIAMTELFGGFQTSFYQAYSATLPLDAGYPVRRNLYKLYHVLNHLNLFGGGYAAQAENLMDALLAELG